MSGTLGKTGAAAANTTTAAQLLSAAPSAAEKNKQWQRELLMERIRTRSNQHKSFAELSKAMRMSLLEKRYALDAVEKANLQKCLDSMQHCIKVTSRQGLVERLESLSRQLGLKFMEDTSGLFISTDMFFLEIILDANGALTDVKVHHECKIEQQSCSELVNCLNRGDFADFTVQLEGLSSIYQLNAEPKVKTKAFVALQAMETDLYNLFQMQNFTKDSQQLIKTSSVGLVLKRRGGHPMKLIYFVSPYDLISLDTKTVDTLTTELLTSKDIGFSVAVNLEASSANKLQILPIVSVANDPQTGLEMPIYAPLNQQNSMLLPATFVLRLNKPLPVCHVNLRALGLPLGVAADGSVLESADKKEVIVSSIMNLVVQTASEQQLKNSQKGLFVNLPDQTHCYFFTENKQLQATLVTSIPFTEPMQVPKILDFLKRQALFYTLLASCVRTQSKMGNDMDSTTILEVNAISFQQISVSLQHTYEESMATLEFDLRDGNVKCTLYSLTHNYDLLSLKLTKIVEKCLSIPVTIRALLKYWDQETMKLFQRSIGGGIGGGMGGGLSGAGSSAGAYGNFNMSMGTNDAGGGGGGSGGIGGVGMRGGGGPIKMEPNTRQQQLPNMASATTTLGGVGGGGASAASAAAANANVSGIAGFLQYKNEIKQEDFHDSPKSQMQNNLPFNAVDSSSLGGMHQLQQTQQQQHQQQQQQQLPSSSPHEQLAAGKQSEIEIADKYKNIWMDKTNLKNCVSITPISPESNSRGATQQQGVDVKRSVGIEIIPLTSANGANTSGTITTMTAGTPVTQTGVNNPSTITITPINATGKDKKCSNSGTVVGGGSGLNANTSTNMTTVSNKRPLDVPSPSDAQKEKKRKKKRDDSPMGPPEKVYSRQNSPAATSETAATVAARKFSSPSSSPKGGSSSGMLGSGSVGTAGNAALLSTRPSPKHSPVYSSPKHSNTASNSPKSPFGTHSPKHGSSGKPSMSTLKSATATSLSPKGDKGGCGNASGLVSNTVGLSAAAAAGVAAANAVKTAMGLGGSGSGSGGAGSGAVSMQQMKSMNHLTATQAMNTAGVGGAGGGGAAYGSGVSNMSNMGSGGGGGGGVGQLLSGNGAGGGMDINAAVAASQAAAMRKVVSSAVSSTASTMSVAPTTATTIATPTAQPVAPLSAQQHSPPQPRAPDIGNSESTSTVGGDGDDDGGGVGIGRHAESTQSYNSSSEYMVKPSQEGLKLTINKTSSGGGKSSNNSSSSSGTSTISSTTTTTTAILKGSKATSSTKKMSTGLKPGVSSGPASRKLTSGGKLSSKKGSTAKHPFQKSISSGSLSTKSSSDTAGSLTKSYSTNTFGDLNAGGQLTSSRKSSKKGSSSSSTSSSSNSSTSTSSTTPATRLDHQADMLKILHYASPAMAANMEQFIKGINSKFQIPKLSQRASNLSNGIRSAPATPTALSPALNNIGSSAIGLTRAENQGSEALQMPSASASTSMQLNANYHLQQKTENVQMQYANYNQYQQNQQQLGQQQQSQQQQSQQQQQKTQNLHSQQQQAILSVDYHHQANAHAQQMMDEPPSSSASSSTFVSSSITSTSTGHVGK